MQLLADANTKSLFRWPVDEDERFPVASWFIGNLDQIQFVYLPIKEPELCSIVFFSNFLWLQLLLL